MSTPSPTRWSTASPASAASAPTSSSSTRSRRRAPTATWWTPPACAVRTAAASSPSPACSTSCSRPSSAPSRTTPPWPTCARRPPRGCSSTSITSSPPCAASSPSASPRSAAPSATRSPPATSSSAIASSSRWRWSSSSCPAPTRSGTTAGSRSASTGGPAWASARRSCTYASTPKRSSRTTPSERWTSSTTSRSPASPRSRGSPTARTSTSRSTRSSPVARSFLTVLIAAYAEEEVRGEKRTLLRLHKRLAPIKAAVLPLSRNEQLVPPARKVSDLLRPHFMTQYDDAQSIGRRYRRQDEIGTPLCVTVDFDTLEDEAVTIRARGSMEQGGGGTTGEKKIPLEAGAPRLFFDFGTTFATRDLYFEEYLKPRPGVGLLDLLDMDLLPPLEGLYRPDLVPSGDVWARCRERPGYRETPSVDAVLVSHAHVDHTGYISFLREDVPVYASATTAFIAKAMQDSSMADFEKEVCYITPREEHEGYLRVARESYRQR